jgi:hypothetical protein
MTKQMTPLRQRMIEDMTIRNMSPSRPAASAALRQARSSERVVRRG